MSTADIERARAARLSDDDVLGVLLDQHARIRDLFDTVRGARARRRQQAFDELRVLLVAHETAEEMILRPVTDQLDAAVARARNKEENGAARELKALEKLDVHGAEFDRRIARFEKAVSDHARREEREEFPLVREARSDEQLEKLGRKLRAAEKIAPTHPHPSTAGSPAAQWMVGPAVSIIDRVRDVVR